MYCILNYINLQYFVVIASGLAAGDGVWTQPEWNQHCLRRLWRTCRGHHSYQQHQRYCSEKNCHPYRFHFVAYSYEHGLLSKDIIDLSTSTGCTDCRAMSRRLSKLQTLSLLKWSIPDPPFLSCILMFHKSLTSRLQVHIINIHIP